MQIWSESSHGVYPNRDVVSRFWNGSSSDVSEVQIDDPSDQEEALSLIGLVPWILVRCSDWTMVPLENLVAASRGTSTRIAAAIDKEVELNGAAFALGAEGVQMGTRFLASEECHVSDDYKKRIIKSSHKARPQLQLYHQRQ